MRDSRLDEFVADRLESETGIERHDITLRVQKHRKVTVLIDHALDEFLSQTLLALVGSDDDAADQMPGILVFGHSVFDDTQVGDRAPRLGDEEVNGRGLFVTAVEFGLVDVLFDEEDIGAQAQQVIELVGCELAPCLLNDGMVWRRLSLL